jgi:hypothetical protein
LLGPESRPAVRALTAALEAFAEDAGVTPA